ncbi:MAG: GHKL domain-containing protein [Propionivibrio sp.]|uniref:histidine kinase n=1 Tax=Candidatus Propionivibrio dominans TaxID=2954373 RepID=A0A9D7FEC0_9RHOO|nr:GHKL domain-containing protein [Candidatus Propionivibrio dominans]
MRTALPTTPLRLVCPWVVAVILAFAGLGAARAAEIRNVLVLYANSRLLPANVQYDQGLLETIRTSADRPVALFDEFLDVARFGGQAYTDTVVSYLRTKYASRPPALIVVANEEALSFLVSNRAALFPQAPVVHMSVGRSFLRMNPALSADIVGVPIEYEFSGTIEQALRWHPQARHLVIVTGASVRDRGWEARLRSEVPRFMERASAEFLAGLPTAAVLKRLGELGNDSVVFTTGYFTDGDDRSFTPRESVEAMARAATAPVYGPFNTFIGTGIVGGRMPNYAAMGRQAGEIVNALLDGAAPDSLRLPEIMPTTLNVDWRQVRRWGIDETSIPGDAIVHFREPGLWEEHHKDLIAGAIVFLLQAALIAWLLFERRHRRLAEQANQKQRFELAHASRLAVVGELTGSIAHEINQPLGAILSNADAAELMLESAADRRGELREILADIRRDDLRASEVIHRLRLLLIRQEVERQAFDLNEVVSEMASLLRSEVQRRGFSLDIQTAPTSATLVGDRIQIQQVLINLVLNALDAVADLPEARRTILVSVAVRAGAIAIAVSDRGHGIAPANLPQIFDSFFTTKPQGMGLGLSIARTIVEAHGGRLRAENRPGGGAVFRVEWPVADAKAKPAVEVA